MKDGIALNSVELKALRLKLGTTVKDFSSLADVSVDPRTIRYWEANERTIPLGISPVIKGFVAEYKQSFKPILTQDVMVWGYENGQPPALPSFSEFEDFKAATGCDSLSIWRMWQQAVASLFLEGLIESLTTDSPIPADFVVWKVLRGEQTVEQAAQDNANKRLKIWYIHQVPSEPYEQFVDNIADARLVLNSMYNLMLNLSNNRIIPDYSNVGGLNIYADADGSGKRDWYEWEDFDACSISDDNN